MSALAAITVSLGERGERKALAYWRVCRVAKIREYVDKQKGPALNPLPRPHLGTPTTENTSPTLPPTPCPQSRSCSLPNPHLCSCVSSHSQMDVRELSAQVNHLEAVLEKLKASNRVHDAGSSGPPSPSASAPLPSMGSNLSSMKRQRSALEDRPGGGVSACFLNIRGNSHHALNNSVLMMMFAFAGVGGA